MNNKSDMHPVYRNLHTIHRQKGVNSNMQKALLIAEKPSLKDKIEKVYEEYNVYKVDCSLSEQKNIALNQIFEKRQEMLISKIDEIAKKIKSAK